MRREIDGQSNGTHEQKKFCAMVMLREGDTDILQKESMVAGWSWIFIEDLGIKNTFLQMDPVEVYRQDPSTWCLSVELTNVSFVKS